MYSKGYSPRLHNIKKGYYTWKGTKYYRIDDNFTADGDIVDSAQC